MKLNGVHHVSINVLDVERATAFYVEKLGMRILPRPDIGVAGVWLGAGAQEVHLIASDDATRAPGQHFAFGVDDLDATVAELVGHGLKVSNPMTQPHGARQCFIKDTEGNLVEFNQPAPQPAAV
jgi:catechol 2,3-dioxygenase-like lactoylglutathione lyase family enzyme